ncbi:MAG TPA: ankyrin repeat domain-containing protein [Pyrinomonadaceae bacterium]|nr:ankyrin repeat domain-containing protein [Pyrinomonadaceae bacterium]
MPTRAEGLGLTVNFPCTAEWDSMSGNEQVRFCTHCEKSVHNLSAMTRKDALRLVRDNAGGVCVRFYSDPRGRAVHTNDRALYRITRRASKLAAGAFGAAVTLSASVTAQTPEGRQEQAAYRLDARAAASLTGTVLDANGALVAGASVTAYNAKSGDVRTTTTNAGGFYRIESLPPGTYTVMFSAEGFERESAEKLELQAGVEQRQDVILLTPGMKPAAAEEAEEEEGEEAGDEASCPTDAGEESKAVEEAKSGESAESDETTDEPSTQEEGTRVVRPAIMGMVAVRKPENPLVKAVFEHNVPAAKNLIALGADVNVLDKATDTTALMQAVTNGDAEMVSALISAGADVNMKASNGDTALTRLGDGATVALVRALTSAGAKVNHKNRFGSTALINTAEYDAPEVLKELLESGAKADAKNKSGRTALMEAAQYGLVENVKLLLDAGADVNARDADGETALKLAKALAPDGTERSEVTDEAPKKKKSKEEEDVEQLLSKLSKEMVALLLSYGAIEQ